MAFILALLFSGHLLATEKCPLKESNIWAHYADEWGHDEKPEKLLTRKDIRINNHEAQWLYLPKTCTKNSCDVSFIVKISKDCWKPLLSLQGKVKSFQKNNWSKFKNSYIRSAVNKNIKAEQIWRFNEKDQKFEQEFKASR